MDSRRVRVITDRNESSARAPHLNNQPPSPMTE